MRSHVDKHPGLREYLSKMGTTLIEQFDIDDNQYNKNLADIRKLHPNAGLVGEEECKVIALANTIWHHYLAKQTEVDGVKVSNYHLETLVKQIKLLVKIMLVIMMFILFNDLMILKLHGQLDGFDLQQGGTTVKRWAGGFAHVNFTGAGVSCALSSGVVTCTVTGGSITNNPGGANTNIQFNDGGTAFGGAAVGTYNKASTKFTFQLGSHFDFVDPTDTTKAAEFDVSAFSTGTTRTFKLPNLNNLTLLPATNVGTAGQPCMSNGDGSCTFADPVTSGNQASATVQTITATGAKSGVTVTNIGQVLVTVSGTYAGVAFNFEASPDGTFSPAFPVFAAEADAASVVTATGALPSNTTRAWWVDVAGFTQFRVNATTYTSGTATVTITPIYFQFTPWSSVSVLGTVPVSGTFWQTTQPVSVASLPLPSGASTAANQCGFSGTPCEVSKDTSVNSATDPLFVEPTDGTSAMGAMANFGTSPGAVKSVNTNSSIYLGTGAPDTNTGNASAQTLRAVLASNQPAIPVNNTPQSPAAGTYVGSVTPQPSTNSGDALSGCYAGSGTGTAASTNATNCKASAGNFYGVLRAVNTTGTIVYLRMYNTSAAPTCSSSTGFVESIPIPSNSNTGTVGAGIVSPQTFGINYSTGISFCVTGGGGNTDNTNAVAGVYITLGYK